METILQYCENNQQIIDFIASEDFLHFSIFFAVVNSILLIFLQIWNCFRWNYSKLKSRKGGKCSGFWKVF